MNKDKTEEYIKALEELIALKDRRILMYTENIGTLQAIIESKQAIIELYESGAVDPTR
jgi:hypothetical protein